MTSEINYEFHYVIFKIIKCNCNFLSRDTFFRLICLYLDASDSYDLLRKVKFFLLMVVLFNF